MQPTTDEIIAAVSAQLQCPEAAAIAYLTQLQRDFDPKAAAERLAEREGRLLAINHESNL
jgi:hypothetical protein